MYFERERERVRLDKRSEGKAEGFLSCRKTDKESLSCHANSKHDKNALASRDEMEKARSLCKPHWIQIYTQQHGS
jgi:hypothetical protein